VRIYGALAPVECQLTNEYPEHQDKVTIRQVRSELKSLEVC